MVTTGTYVPDRGDLVWVDLNPQAGHEQAGRRPAVIVSPRAYNVKVGLALLCPITSQIKGYPFEVAVPDDCGVSGVILSDQLKSMDWRIRNADFIGVLPSSAMEEVLARILVLLQ